MEDLMKQLAKLEKETTLKQMSASNFVKFMLLALEMHAQGIKHSDIKLKDGTFLKI